MSFQPNHQRPRIASASSTATISTAALVPRSTSATRSSLGPPRRPLSPPSREPIESYSLWQPILRASDQIVLYNPASHAINIVPASLNTVSTFSLPFTNGQSSNQSSICPYCNRPMDEIPHDFAHDRPRHVYNMPQIEMSPEYFQVLQDVNGGAIAEDVYEARRPNTATQESFARFEDASFEDNYSPSQRWSRVSIDSDSGSNEQVGVADSLRSLSGSSAPPEIAPDASFGASTIRLASTANGSPATADPRAAESEYGGVNAPKPSSGYYATFFREETRLGMGANGSVYLCQHVLNGIPLGHFAVKKIAVGDSPAYLMEILREASDYIVLMQWAELGSLDDLILQRLGIKAPDRDPDPSEPLSGEYQTREERIRAFRARAGGGPTHTSGDVRKREARRRARDMKAVHLLSAEEIRSLFGDVVAGLAFLHESSFLHLDLKPGNVLLTLDEGQLIPRAMLSDFGTAQDALQSTRERSGNTGTLEYSAPESLRHNQDGSLRQITSKSDVWSLGMILHKLIYFGLPWKNDEDMAELEKEIIGFQGYKANAENIQTFEKRRLPAALCQLLSKMLAVEPGGRPGSDQVLKAIHARQLDPPPDLSEANPHPGMGPLVRRPTPPSRGNESLAVSSDPGIDDPGALGPESSPHLPSVDRRGRVASGTQARRRSDPVGEITDIAPRLLVLDGPAPAATRVVGLLSGINLSRVLSRGFKSALLICKASTFKLILNRGQVEGPRRPSPDCIYPLSPTDDTPYQHIIFVPGSMGRFFLTISRASAILWTLEPDGVPHSCRSIVTTPANDMIIQALVSRPGSCLVAYLAVQITQQHTHRLRTEIYQLHLSRPGILYDSGFGLSAIHETEGALVASVDYVLAYATNDTGQTILLCCWVSKRATKLVTPVSECEIRWQHSSCRAVAIGTDIVVVVRDSMAEIYPRNEFATIDYALLPGFSDRVIRGTLDMLPVTYATDTATFPLGFHASPSIHIHARQSVPHSSNDVTIRVISLVGVARSAAPLTDPSIPYFVVPAQLYRWTPCNDGSSQSTSPSHTAPPSPSRTTPSPTHTHPSTYTPPTDSRPMTPVLLPAERYKFVFHVHALQHQHPHFSYGPAIAGPNGRAIMLATAINTCNEPDQPKQYVLRYRHPTHRELNRFLAEQLNPTVPRVFRPNSGRHPSVAAQPVPQQAHVQLPPPPPPPPAHPLLNRRPGLHNGMLAPLTRPLPVLDVLRGMSSLWHTQEMHDYEMVAWDEGSGTILAASRLGQVVVLECAKPASEPAGASSWHRG
ncbi:unnamed protein product [Rhizoctonia solani]|uniref:Protein kinase domain-containing protein n=1 Tax=Rhizoctonia solani TaxID=456999 RepID=A0A8H3DR38_9AGAM|nr:unnamed protein product [Rhizoctonia solani]